jgi:hypothetical protein
MFSQPIRLEGFDESLRGHRTLVVGQAESWLARMNMLESEVLYKGHSVLVIQENTKGTGREYPALMRRRWDVIFRLRETFDAQMLVTYVQNASKPCRVLWAFPPHGLAEVPKTIWTRWNAGNDVTLIGGTESGLLGSVEWETILFQLKSEQSLIERVLTARGPGIASMLAKVKDHLSEISESGAAVAWSNIDEEDKKGKLYWYDPSEGTETGEMYNKKEVSDILQSVSKWLLK